MNDIGRYVSFCKEDGSALSWLQPVKNFMPNGLHAIMLTKGPNVRLDMYRFEASYDLLITSHTVVNEESAPKPKLETKMIYFQSLRSPGAGIVGQGEDVPQSSRAAVLHVERQ